MLFVFFSTRPVLRLLPGGMRLGLLVVWAGLTLSCCALVGAGGGDEDAEEENGLSGGRAHLREARGLAEPTAKPGEEGGVRGLDEGEERKKPKKKKTPEEVEAGKTEPRR